jgi:hypothetical protein
MQHGFECAFVLEAVGEGIPDDGDAVAFLQREAWFLSVRMQCRNKGQGQGKEWTDHDREADITPGIARIFRVLWPQDAQTESRGKCAMDDATTRCISVGA